jgi:hypothetical protein
MKVHGDRQMRTRRLSRWLVLLGITAVALAASPAALADDRGGPGAPSVQHSNPFHLVLRLSLPRLASWSD